VFKLIVQNSKVDAYADFFSVRIIDVWNRLSDEIVNASSIWSFYYELAKDKSVKTDLFFALIGKQ